MCAWELEQLAIACYRARQGIARTKGSGYVQETPVTSYKIDRTPLSIAVSVDQFTQSLKYAVLISSGNFHT